MKIKDWLSGRRHRIAESHRAAEQTRAERDRIRSQWPEVQGLVGFSRGQRETNHLTDLFFAMHRGSE